MMKLETFLALTVEQEIETLVAAYLDMSDSLDRYRAMCAVKALAQAGREAGS